MLKNKSVIVMFLLRIFSTVIPVSIIVLQTPSENIVYKSVEGKFVILGLHSKSFSLRSHFIMLLTSTFPT